MKKTLIALVYGMGSSGLKKISQRYIVVLFNVAFNRIEKALKRTAFHGDRKDSDFTETGTVKTI